jgi:hypothetical protein
MLRGFTGARGGGGTNGSSVHKKVSAKERYITKVPGVPDSTEMTREDMYKQRLDERMLELKAEAMKGRDGRELSKSALIAIDLLAAKQAKAAAKRAAKRKKIGVEVKARALVGRFGGRIDGKGNIYGPDNKTVGKVDLKTGKIKNKSGGTIGTYGKANSDHIIASYIEKVYSAPSAHGSIFGSATAASIWGSTGKKDDPTGGFWG